MIKKFKLFLVLFINVLLFVGCARGKNNIDRASHYAEAVLNGTFKGNYDYLDKQDDEASKVVKKYGKQKDNINSERTKILNKLIYLFAKKFDCTDTNGKSSVRDEVRPEVLDLYSNMLKNVDFSIESSNKLNENEYEFSVVVNPISVFEDSVKEANEFSQHKFGNDINSGRYKSKNTDELNRMEIEYQKEFVKIMNRKLEDAKPLQSKTVRLRVNYDKETGRYDFNSKDLYKVISVALGGVFRG